jgi:hypothetical protein
MSCYLSALLMPSCMLHSAKLLLIMYVSHSAYYLEWYIKSGYFYCFTLLMMFVLSVGLCWGSVESWCEDFDVHMVATIQVLSHTLPSGRTVKGLAMMTNEVNELFLIRAASSVLEVYDTTNYRFSRNESVDKIISANDMTSCSHFRCLYVADRGNEVSFIHRVEVEFVLSRSRSDAGEFACRFCWYFSAV